MAIIDYSERIKNGEQIVLAPLLNKNSTIEDYKIWINRPDMQHYNPVNEISAKIISASPEATTMIVWLKNGAPVEIHDKDYVFLHLWLYCSYLPILRNAHILCHEFQLAHHF